MKKQEKIGGIDMEFMLLRVRLQNMDRTSHVLDNEMERD